MKDFKIEYLYKGMKGKDIMGGVKDKEEALKKFADLNDYILGKGKYVITNIKEEL